MYLAIFISTLLAALVLCVATYVYHKIKTIKTEPFSFDKYLEELHHPVLTVQHDGMNLNFLVDTGAEFSMIRPDIVEKLKIIDIMKIENGFTEGVGGRVKVTNALIFDVFINKDRYRNIYMIQQGNMVAFDTVSTQFGYKIHGILGSLWLRDNNATIDYNKRTIKFIYNKKIQNYKFEDAKKLDV